MMSNDNNIQLESETLIIKDNGIGNKLSKEEECEYYKQRFNSLRIVLADFQNELSACKQRCLGVSTIQLMLKESRQENIKLSKHAKALETAISILQKRLEKNGLSNSVNTQDAELFAPSASKQIFDNLAKETARLRSLLKQDNGLLGKQSADELEEMKVALEEAESENNELKNKMKDMEDVKLKLVSDYEGAIDTLTKEIKDEKEKHEKELKAKAKCVEGMEHGKIDLANSGAVQELKHLLIKTVEKCSIVNEQLSHGITDTHTHVSTGAADKKERRQSVSKEDYERLEIKHQEAVTMNQKWQMYSKERELQFQEKIQELSDPHHMTALIDEATNQKTEQLSLELDRKSIEVETLRGHLNHLSKELNDARQHQSQMQEESSIVEILKQQIQVCTEDFKTERKDREKAVQKAKALQDDVNQLTAENTSLKRQNEELKKTVTDQQKKQLNKPPSYEASLNSSSYAQSHTPPHYSNSYVQSPNSQYSYSVIPVQESPAQGVDHNVAHALPFSSTTHGSFHNTGQRSPVQSYTNMQATSNIASSSSNYPSMPQQAAPNSPTSTIYHSMPRPPGPTVQGSSTPSLSSTASSTSRNNYASLPRSPLSNSHSHTAAPFSNAQVMRRGGAAKEEMSCPKCNKTFSDETLVLHIDACAQ